MRRVIFVNSRDIQYQVQNIQNIRELLDEVIYIRDPLALLDALEQHEPYLVILHLPVLRDELLGVLATAKSKSLLPGVPTVVVTNEQVPQEYRGVFTSKLPLKYSFHQLGTMVTDNLRRMGNIMSSLADIEEEDKPSVPALTDQQTAELRVLKASLEEQQAKRDRLAQAVLDNEKKQLQSAFGSFTADLLSGTGFEEKMTALLDQYLKADDVSARQELRKQLSVLFWQLHKEVAYQLCTEKEIPLAKRLFLRYGIVDPRLLTDELVEFICSQGLVNVTNDPIWYFDEWMEKIYAGKFEISVTDETQMKIPAKEYPTIKGNKALTVEHDTYRVMYNVATGVKGVHFPVLDKEFIRQPEISLCTRTTVREHLRYVEETADPLIFQRITPLGLRHIHPNVLIIPAYGLHGTCWQPWQKSDRDSAGRIICPMVSQTSVEENVVKSLGSFRWEYARDKSPVYYMQEGLIADYHLQHKGVHGDLSEKFIQDYHTWVTREAKNRPLLSKELRQFFWKHAPFGREIMHTIEPNNAFRELYEKRVSKTCLI